MESQEELTPKYIFPFSPESPLHSIGEYQFVTDKVRVGDFGRISLWGLKGVEYAESDMGIAIVSGNVVKKPAEEFTREGLFGIALYLDTVIPAPNANIIVCDALLPDGQLLKNIRVRTTASQTDPTPTLDPNADKWQVANDKNKYVLFTRLNPSDISQLGFRLSTKVQERV